MSTRATLKEACTDLACGRFARELIVRIEGDRAGIIDEPWSRDVHHVCGRVQDRLQQLSAEAASERMAKRQAAKT